MGDLDPPHYPASRQLAAWLVHLYTGMGLVLAAGMAVLICRGDPASLHLAFWLMLAACAIDATDGTLARAAEVKKVLPGFDGARLDDITDFLTYTFLPLFLLWRADILPGAPWVLLFPLLASAYGFCQTDAKTADGYFLGFPSYWNIVAFYLYVLRPAEWVSQMVLIVLAALTFVPSRYLYPSQRGLLNRTMAVLAILWACLIVWLLAHLPSDLREPTIDMDRLRWLTGASLSVPVYYFFASWAVSLKIWFGSQRKPEVLEQFH